MLCPAAWWRAVIAALDVESRLVDFPGVVIRPFAEADAPRVCEIFYRSVHEVAIAKYSPEQAAAWAPAVPDAARWLTSLRDFHTFVADDRDGTTIAWIAMTDAGYIDMLFCLPEAAGRGIAAQLYRTVEDIARERGLARLTVHASLLAQSFFAKHGWRVDEHETVVRNGVNLPRAAMSKELLVDGQPQAAAVTRH
jgi:putative acetyltransferase